MSVYGYKELEILPGQLGLEAVSILFLHQILLKQD